MISYSVKLLKEISFFLGGGVLIKVGSDFKTLLFKGGGVKILSLSLPYLIISFCSLSGLSWESNRQRIFPAAFAMMEKVTEPAFRQEADLTRSRSYH